MKKNFIKAIDYIDRMLRENNKEDYEITIDEDKDCILCELNTPYEEICKLTFVEYDFLKELYITNALELKSKFPLFDFAFAFSDFDKDVVYTGIINGTVIYDAFTRKDVSKKD